MLPGFPTIIKTFRRTFGIFLALVVAVALYSCANVMAPTGGPEDESPPVVIRMEPANNSPNFVGNEVRVFFNEFVQVTNINQKLLVSPPMETQPNVRIRGRSIIVSWAESLRDSTTYNFFLGDAIADITERNAIPNFQIVFSTGPYVDSLSLAGTVKDAFTQKPSEGVYVMMYPWGNDSLPFLQRPVYLAKTDKQGQFRIGNTGHGAYLIFALNDLNANFLFDLPNEKIAFLDTLVRPEWIVQPVAPESTDTLPTAEPQTTAPAGHNAPRGGNQTNVNTGARQATEQVSAAAIDPNLPASHRLSLRIFAQADTIQHLRSGTVARKGFMSLAMRIPFDTLSLRNLNIVEQDTKWYVSEPSPNRDTLMVWFLPPLPDSLRIEVSDSKNILDTLFLATQPRAVRGRQEQQEAEPRFTVSLNAGNRTNLPFFETLVLTAENPIKLFDTAAVSLFESDTLKISSTFSITGDAHRRLRLETMLEPAKSYTLLLLPNALTDIYGQTNDTLRVRFTTTKPEDYGLLILNIQRQVQEGRLLAQLATPEGRTVHEIVVPEGGVCRFENIRPGNYLLRVIFDSNKNGIWDPGHFLNRVQPERVLVHPQQLQIRPNWESELNWNIGP